jgi:histidine triad (HIT) family protein
MATIFSRIIDGDIPSYKIYEDEYVFAFLDIHPIQPGHILIVPKYEADYFVDLPEPFYTALFQAARPSALAVQEATQCTRVGTLIEGFDVPHVHLHLVPMFQDGDLFSQRLELSTQQMQEVQTRVVQRLQNNLA